jgi:hypothetical protein
VCKPVCSSGFGDCDGNPSNGCEVDLTTPSACGACGNVCNGATQDCVNSGGVYKCQARVSYVTDAETQASGTTLDLSTTLGTGSNRLVLATVVVESTNSSGLTGATPTAVSYGTIPMTLGASQTSDSGSAAFDNPYLFYYYLTDSGTNHLPASGTQTLHVAGATGSPAKVVMIAANLSQFTGVNQTAPFVTGTPKILTNTGATCVDTSSVTTSLQGTALFVASAAHYSGTATVTGSQLTSSPIWNSGSIGNQVRVYATYGGTGSNVLAAGSYTIGFTWQWCNPSLELPLGIVPYRQP